MAPQWFRQLQGYESEEELDQKQSVEVYSIDVHVSPFQYISKFQRLSRSLNWSPS